MFQSGVHVPHNTAYHAARLKHWPRQKIPQNFNFLTEQKFKAKAIPRDTGKIPRDFVLSVLYRHQPCNVHELWDLCAMDPKMVLDSKRHLRLVLQQIRAEGFLVFEKNLETQHWECHLTRERYQEVRLLVVDSAGTKMEGEELEDAGAFPEEELREKISSMSLKEKEEYLHSLEKRLAETTAELRKYQQVTADYLPYTDLNGKVHFMWWYEVEDANGKTALPHADSVTSSIESHQDTAI